MYQIFQPEYQTFQLANIKPPSFNVVNSMYKSELDKAIAYYQSRPFTINNSHILIRMLNIFMIDIHLPLERFVGVFNDRGPYIAKYFRLTSPISYGSLHKGEFYGPKIPEMIIYNDEYFNPFEYSRDWTKYSAVTVLSHPITDINLVLPTGLTKSTAEGLAVISINIPLLFLQFRCWLLEQVSRIGYSETQLTTANFVHMYILPGMLSSHLDICIMNRLGNLVNGAPMSESIKVPPFPMIDYSNKIDLMLSKLLTKLSNHPSSYLQYLLNIPTISHTTMLDALKMPEVVRTKQLWWLLMVTRIKEMRLLIEIGGNRGLSSNIMLVNQLRVNLRRLLRDSAPKIILTNDMYYQLQEDIEFILN